MAGGVWGDPHLERVALRGGQRIKADIWAVDPISDIAVLGEPDGQRSDKECEQWADALAAIEPVLICVDEFPLNEPFLVLILTHNKGWVEAQAKQTHVNGGMFLVLLC